MTRCDSACCQPRIDSSAPMLKLARQATARIVTATIEATAEAADMERSVLFRQDRSCPPGLATNPQTIRDLVRSPAYTDLIEKYVAGQIDDHFLTQVLNLFRLRLPGVLA